MAGGNCRRQHRAERGLGRHGRWLLPAAAAALALLGPAYADGVVDPMGPGRVDYVIICPEGLAAPCEPLLEHRQQQGLRTALVTMQALRDALGCAVLTPADIVRFLRHARDDWGLRFVLLVGDAVGPPDMTIPMSIEQGAYYSDRFLSERGLATDYLYSSLGGEEPILHVGRFPADTPDEVAAMVGKTIAYETRSTPGPWQRKLSFVTGAPGFDPFIDAVITGLFIRLVSQELPALYDVEIADAKPESYYCTYPPEFNANALRLLNEGSLFYVYAGHGMPTGCDDLRWQGGTYPILEVADLGRVGIPNGAPLMVVIACHTGRVDWPKGDCLGEQAMRLQPGPVAYLGASRVCQPYGNAVLAEGILSATFGEAPGTLGEALSEARRLTLLPDTSPLRQQADAIGAAIQGPDALPRMRRDVVRHYNLLGDPAVRLHVPRSLTIHVQPAEGKLLVTGSAPMREGTCLVSLETARDRYVRTPGKVPPPTDPGFAQAMRDRYVLANDKAISRAEVGVSDGAFAAELPLPTDLQPGTYPVKAFAWDNAGAAAGAAEYVVEGR